MKIAANTIPPAIRPIISLVLSDNYPEEDEEVVLLSGRRKRVLEAWRTG